MARGFWRIVLAGSKGTREYLSLISRSYPLVFQVDMLDSLLPIQRSLVHFNSPKLRLTNTLHWLTIVSVKVDNVKGKVAKVFMAG